MAAKAKGFRIQSVVVYLAIDDDGHEGVIGFASALGWVPAVCADDRRDGLVEEKVRDIVRATGKKVRKVRFTTRVEEGLVK